MTATDRCVVEVDIVGLESTKADLSLCCLLVWGKVGDLISRIESFHQEEVLLRLFRERKECMKSRVHADVLGKLCLAYFALKRIEIVSSHCRILS